MKKKFYRGLIIVITIILVFTYYDSFVIKASEDNGIRRPHISVKVVDSKIIITIKKNNNVSGYLIYIKGSSDKQYKLIRMIKTDGYTKEKCTVESTKVDEYKIKVKAFNDNSYSVFSKVKKAIVTEENDKLLTKKEFKESEKYGARISTFKLTDGCADIVFLGDSITAYIDWHEFFPGINLLNRGIEGDTWVGVLNRIDEIILRQPKKIVLMVGTNEIANGIMSEQIINNAIEVIYRIQTELPDTQIILCDVLPSPKLDCSIVKDVDLGYSIIANTNNNILNLKLIDLYLNSDGSVNEGLFSLDKIHLNGKGYLIWIDKLKTIINN